MGAGVHKEAAADIQARDGGDPAAWVVDGSKKFLRQTSRAWEWDVGQGIRAFWASWVGREEQSWGPVLRHLVVKALCSAADLACGSIGKHAGAGSHRMGRGGNMCRGQGSGHCQGDQTLGEDECGEQVGHKARCS